MLEHRNCRGRVEQGLIKKAKQLRRPISTKSVISVEAHFYTLEERRNAQHGERSVPHAGR